MKRDNKKVAARRSPNCIRKTKKNKIRRFLKWLWDHHIEFARWQQPAKWHVALGWSLNSPGGTTLHVTGGCGMTWHWIRQVAAPCNVTHGSKIMTLTSPKRPPYWSSTSGFDVDRIAAVDMSFCTSVRNFIQIRPSTAEKWRNLDFQDGGLRHLIF